MPDAPLTSEISLVESLSKVFAVALGVLYLLGFLVVAAYLSQFGVSSFSVLQLQYLLAGIWLLGPPVFHSTLLYASRRFDDRVAPEVAGKIFNWRRFIFSSLISGLPAGIFIVLLNLIPGVIQNMTWGIGIRFLAFALIVTNLASLIWMCWRVHPENEKWWINRSHAAPFYATALCVLLIGYAVWFSVRIYPLIPSSLGGGRPLTVIFFEGEKKMPDDIHREGSTKRSIPYKLVLSTDKYYVVLSPSSKERSMEVSRDSVAGMIVLE
jgi:hypothetical protein